MSREVKKIQFIMRKSLYDKMIKYIENNDYVNNSDFIRDAIKEKIERDI